MSRFDVGSRDQDQVVVGLTSGTPDHTNTVLTKGLNFILCFIAIGVLSIHFLSWFKLMTIIDAIYFIIVTFATVGYGDFHATSSSEKLFTAIYALVGVVALSIALGIIGQQVFETKDSTVVEMNKKVDKSLLKMMMEDDGSDLPLPGDINGFSCLSLLNAVHVHFCSRLYAMMFIMGLCFIIGYIEGWSVVSTIYFLFITSTTIGFGDFAPTTQATKMFTALLIPMAVVAIGDIFTSISSTLIDLEAQKAKAKLYKKNLAMADLLMKKDRNALGNAEVSRLEFIEQMLVLMDKVAIHEIENIHELFYRLDVSGNGTLDKNDVLKRAEGAASVLALAREES